MKRSAVSPASTAQRSKVAEKTCVVCLNPAVDPAHLIDRSLGGCDDALCVIPACRKHHREYDDGHLDLLPFLEPRYRDEMAHAVQHLGLARAYMRITNERGW